MKNNEIIEQEEQISENFEENIENINLEQKIDQLSLLKLEIIKKDGEIKALEEKILRMAADIDNTKKRLLRESDEAIKFSIFKFAKEIIDTYDILEVALSHIKQENIEENSQFQDLYNGLKISLDGFQKIFENFNIKKISPLNEKFDHNFHEAISRISNENEAGMIVQVIRNGYSIYERLLRPALVVVSSGK